MDPKKIQEGLQTQWLGKRIYFEETIDSTSLWAKRRLQENAERGDVFLSDFQTEGYGRKRAPWISSSGTNILMSFIDVGSEPMDKSPELTLVTGVAFAEALLQLFPSLPLRLKWPNDLYVDGAKLGGILCELVAPYTVVGVGINVGDHPELASPFQATSLKAYASPPAREEIIPRLLNTYEGWRDTYDRRGLGPIKESWESHAV